jgi:hypothetical protein
MTLRRFAVGLSLGLVLVGLAAPLWAAARAGEDFESRLSAFRKGMIAACAQFQVGKPRESVEQFDAELAALEGTWASLASDFREAPPALYAGDAKWPQYFDSVRENLQAMRASVASGRYGKAFETCGATCALFVTMHESNGISTACDKLFEFRKQAKLMLGQIKNGHPEAAGLRLPALLAQRDAVLLTPVPGKAAGERDEYLRLVREFSNSVDAFATALVNDTPAGALTSYEAMMKAFTAFYNRYV